MLPAIRMRKVDMAVGTDKEEMNPQKALRERVSRLEQQARQLEQRSAYYRALFESSPMGHVILSEDGVVLEANAAAERMLGLDEGELADGTLTQFLCDDDKDQYQQIYSQLFTTHENQSFEVRLNHREGRLIEVRIECGLLILPNMTDSAVCHMVLNDVSSYREAQRVLRQNEARYRLLFENSPVALLVLDSSKVKESLDSLKAQGVEDLDAYLTNHPNELISLWKAVLVTDANRAAQELYEAPDKAALLSGLPVPRDVQQLHALRDSLLAISEGKVAFSAERVVRTLTGQRRDVALQWTVTPGFEETYARVLVSQVDITHLKRMESDLAQRELLYRTMLGNLPGIVLMTYDPDMRYLLVEGQGVAMLGSDPADLEGKTIFEALPPNAAAELLPYYRAALQGETVRFQRVSGGFVFDVMALPVYQEHKIIGGLIFARNISEEKEREIVVWQERQRIARDLHDAISQTLFSANMIVDALPYILERSPERMPAELDKLRLLTDSALAEMRNLLVELRPYAIAEAGLDDLLSQLIKSNASRTETTFSLSIVGLDDVKLPLDVKEAFYRITQQALNNIINHAHAEQAGIDLHAESGQVTLAIHDNGRGFDLADVPQGRMGLMIMQERAETIGAKFEVNSQRGSGTEIRITWRVGKENRES